MKRRTKITALALTVLLLAASLPAGVFAEGEFPITVGFEVRSSSVSVGESFRVNTALQFDADTFWETDWILAFRYGLRFDPDYLELLDPVTMQPVAFAEDGSLAEGSALYIFGNLGLESSFSANLNADGRTITVFYGGQDAAGDITEPGPIAQFAFRAREDLEVNGSLTTALEIVSPEIAVNNREAVLDIRTQQQTITITPPFTMQNLGGYPQNTTLTVSGRCSLTEENLPLTAQILQEDAVLAEVPAQTTDTRYTVSFDLSEEQFAVGTYWLVLTGGVFSDRRMFQVVAKNEPPVLPDEPEDEAGDEPEDEPGDLPDDTDTNPDDSSDTPGSNSGSGSGSSSGGSTSNSGTSGGISSSGSTSGGTSDSSEPDDSAQTVTPDANVVYPDDIAQHWAKANIEYVYDHALMNGYADGTFLPDNSITRAEFSAVMARFLQLSEAPDAAWFADTDGHWARGYIGALTQAGIVSGISETAFAPDANITREQMAVILSRAFALTETAADGMFSDDEQISAWAYDGVYQARAAGYMTGDQDGNFLPLANATRAEVATVIYRLHTAQS